MSAKFFTCNFFTLSFLLLRSWLCFGHGSFFELFLFSFWSTLGLIFPLSFSWFWVVPFGCSRWDPRGNRVARVLFFRPSTCRHPSPEGGPAGRQTSALRQGLWSQRWAYGRGVATVARGWGLGPGLRGEYCSKGLGSKTWAEGRLL